MSNSPYYDDSWENLELWKIKAIDDDGKVMDVRWEIYDDDVSQVMDEMLDEYPDCNITSMRSSILDCPQPQRDNILRYIEDNREDYEDISFWRNYYEYE